jgi:hypothetical protein
MTLREEVKGLFAFVFGCALMALTPFTLTMHILGKHKLEVPIPTPLLIVALVLGSVLAFWDRVVKLRELVRGSKVKLPSGVEVDLNGDK